MTAINRSVLPLPVRHRDAGILGYVFIVAITLVAAIFSGMLASTGNFFLIAILTAFIVGTGLLFFPVLLLVIVLLGGIVFSGLAEMYMPVLRHIRWAVVLGAVALAVISLLKLMGTKRPTAYAGSKIKQASNTHAGLLIFWFGMLLLLSLFSGLLNTGLSIETLVGLKGYFQVAGILLAFYYLGLSRKLTNQFFLALIPLALLQVPFALHQYFVLLPTRMTQAAAKIGVVAPDVVVGTFIGTVGGGGGNAILASLQVVAIVFMLALWRQGLMRLGTAILLSLICVVPVILNESKITFVMLPLTLGWVFRDYLIKHTMKFVAGVMIVVLLLIGLFLFYAALPRAQGKFTPEQYFENAIRYNIGSQGYGVLALNRNTVYPFWMDRHGLENITETLIGHGPGSSIEGNSGMSRKTLAGQYYPGVGIGLTAGSALLWELGLLGLLAVLALHWAAFVQAGKLARLDVFSSKEKAALLAAQAGVMVLTLNLPHNNYFVFEIGYQTLQFIILGYIAYMARRAVEPGRAT